MVSWIFSSFCDRTTIAFGISLQYAEHPITRTSFPPRLPVQSPPSLAHPCTVQAMSTAARRRLMRDFKRMQTDPPAGVSASPVADNVMTW
ncbi:hypothetical protein PAAG_03446 [Paracoccidioides lutzii Pb01]|uniref:UBC core domain-containing protein n=1 Tax=Paracoccidioides lutzii (strain ATCC MYA-826 / Pb01) TaxID=502779 RepID=C1GX72_PARBA|nr:hypothetical protein PAAG_03446 [Paracoccidioides lutzii Pb01]EEH41160.2 hypothetical protein PAAG_03446 [Paracoccidioides lutzii Pb01]